LSLVAGLEIDGETVRIAILEGSAKKYRLVDYIEGQYSGENLEEQVHSLSDLMNSSIDSSQRASVDFVSSLPARQMVTREISVPYTRDDIIAKTVRYESEGHIHSHNIDDLIIEHLKLSEGKDSSRLLICALPKKILGEHLERLQGADADPMQIELDTTALATTLIRGAPELSEGHVLLIQVEAGYTSFVLLEGGKITKIRSTWNHLLSQVRVPALESGSADSDVVVDDGRSVAEETFAIIEEGIEEEEDPPAEELPFDDEFAIAVVPDDEFERFSREGKAAGAVPPVTPEEAVEQIIVEIERTFAGALMGRPLDRIVVTGTNARSIDAARRLGEYFEVESVALDATSGIEHDLSSDSEEICAQRGAVAIGLALQGIGQGLTTIDLRKDEFRFERRFQRLLPGLILLGLLFCATSVVWLLENHQKKQYYLAEYSQLRQSQADIYKNFFESTPRTPAGTTNYPAAARTKLSELTGESSRGSRSSRIKQFLSPMEMLEDVISAIRKAGPPVVYPKYDSFDIRPEKTTSAKTTLRLNVKDASEANLVVEAIDAHSILFEVEESGKDLGEEKGYQLTLELKLKTSVVGTARR